SGVGKSRCGRAACERWMSVLAGTRSQRRRTDRDPACRQDWLDHRLDQPKFDGFGSLDVPVRRCAAEHFLKRYAGAEHEVLETLVLDFDGGAQLVQLGFDRSDAGSQRSIEIE